MSYLGVPRIIAADLQFGIFTGFCLFGEGRLGAS